ncbi:MAG: hypothetical protein IT310_03505 [Anaerolineales bacterium]|nr:hypothetical protein [Anaerolineales bacterium]
MQRLKTLFALSFLFLSMLACQSLADDEYYEEETPAATEAPIEATEAPAEATEAPAAEEAIACPALMDQIVQTITDSQNKEVADAKYETEMPLVTYTVNGDEISDPQLESVSEELQSLQADEATQRQVWDYFVELIPAERRADIAEYAIFTDGVDNTLAAVVQTQSDPTKWSLQVDPEDTKQFDVLTPTLLHEYAHLLSLGSAQVVPSLAIFNNPGDNDIYLKESSACPNYFTTEGCANADSYLDDFYNQFWVNLHDEWSAINRVEDPTERQTQLDAFYSKYEDQFVTVYAATNPEEDLAEAWSVFVLTPKPDADSIMNQKIAFFYNYPEMVELRSTILSNICTALPKYEK